MADDSSVPPLSRRVPGATNRPKPKMRIAPPVLPEELIGRLRPNQPAAETASAPPRKISGEVPAMPEGQVATVDEASPEEPAGWYVVPDSPASPVADSNDTTQPIPVIAATGQAQSPVKVRVDTRKDQLPRRGGGSRSAGPPRPGGPSTSARTQPAKTQQDRTQPDKTQPAKTQSPGSRPPDTQLAELTRSPGHPQPAEAAPSAEPADGRESRDRPQSGDRTQTAALAAAAPQARQAPKPAAVALHSPEPSLWRRWAARLSRARWTGPQQEGATLLRPLFGDSLSIEEMVATVRAQDAGRRADQNRRFRMFAAALLVVVVATALVVVVVVRVLA